MEENGSFRRRSGNSSSRASVPEPARERVLGHPETPNRGSRKSSTREVVPPRAVETRITPQHRRVAELVVKNHLRVAPDSEFVSLLTRDLDASETDEELLISKLTFNLARFTFSIVQQIDQWVPLYGSHPAEPDSVQVLASRPDTWNFFYYFYEVPLKEASERGCGKFLLRCLCEWIVMHPHDELAVLCQNPAARVARLVDALNFLAASLALNCWESLVTVRALNSLSIPLVTTNRSASGRTLNHLHTVNRVPNVVVNGVANVVVNGVEATVVAPVVGDVVASEVGDVVAPVVATVVAGEVGDVVEWLPELPSQLAGLLHHFTVDVETGDLSGCISEQDPEFQRSEFRVVLVDNYGGLLTLLYELTKLKVFAESGVPVAVAVDLEGVRLSRHGAIALLQMCLSTDPLTVYIVDVVKLGSNTFEVATHSGTSIRRVMEDAVIRKVLFDPRHDVDALYYQYGVVVENVFDLQLAEVALRRARGLSVRYVVGLFKCLYQQDMLLTPEQKKLAEKINDAGKSLFEPEYGGNHEIFLTRPLHPGLLVYASHDARYLLQLHDLFHDQLSVADGDWYGRVLDASQIRARWFMHEEYVTPTTEAPLL